MTAEATDRWADLRPRILSAVVMILIGGGALWLGGAVFAGLATMLTGVMIWELARMTRADGADTAMMLGLLAATMVAVTLWSWQPWAIAALAAPVVAGLITPRRHRAAYAAYASVIMLTGLCAVLLRQSLGLGVVIWLLAVVIASDILGYFAGRILGGPKFWPRVSPKKTWSGTVAGWCGAALVGAGFWAAGHGTVNLIWFSPLVALAGQLGDIAESAIKRRVGVKDSSNLIPGHGGLLDRFDALAFAAILVAVVVVLCPIFFVAGG